jgi:hypothetical protein
MMLLTMNLYAPFIPPPYLAISRPASNTVTVTKRFLETLAECCGKTGWEVPTVVSRCGNPSLKTDKRPTPKPKWHRITFAPRAHLEWHGDQGETQAMASIAG